MIWLPLNPMAMLPYEPYLFRIQSSDDTFYTVGVMDSYNGFKLQKYQYLADCITGYVEIVG